jgi:xanthine dehydrogenase YagR molybdenum-binding subunit
MPIKHIDVLRSGAGNDELQLLEQDTLAPWDEDSTLRIVGQPISRVDGIEKVTGRACYSGDVRLPGQLYACVLRSPHPHARILHIDSSAAEQLAGVHAVLSNVNAPSIDWYPNSKLFDSTVRFAGDEVAAVAAESEEIARDAIALIKVEYETLAFVTDFEQALDASAPPVHAGGNQVGEADIYQRGNVEAGLREADIVIDQVYSTQTAVHNSLEPHGCTAVWTGEELTLWESTQGIFEVREQVAEKLGLAEHRVRVIKHYMGGGFGSKQIAWKHAVIAALLAQRSGRPVQLMLDREAENLASGNRNATWQRVRLGACRDGTLTAISAELRTATGAYNIGGEASMVAGMYQRLYRCANVRTEQRAAYINTGPSVAFRAPGYVEAAFALESAMDELAHALAIDPLTLRLHNYSETDQKEEKPYSSPNGLRRSYFQATSAFDWQHYTKVQPAGAKRYGIGIAAHEWGGAGHAPGYAWVKLNSDGSVDVVTGAQDIGTGTRTGLSQIAAEELGLPVACIKLHLGDTAQGPYAPTSAGSATTPRAR